MINSFIFTEKKFFLRLENFEENQSYFGTTVNFLSSRNLDFIRENLTLFKKFLVFFNIFLIQGNLSLEKYICLSCKKSYKKNLHSNAYIFLYVLLSKMYRKNFLLYV